MSTLAEKALKLMMGDIQIPRVQTEKSDAQKIPGMGDMIDVELVPQKVEKYTEFNTPNQIRVERMTTCLHGKDCRFIVLKDMRQVCRKNNQPIFDMDVCPDGRWWAPKLVDKPNTVQPTRCYCCGGQSFWRKKNNRGGRWICEVCHPPLSGKDEIEWLQ